MDSVPNDVRRAIIAQTLYREPVKESIPDAPPSGSEDIVKDEPSQKQSLGGLLEQTLLGRGAKQTPQEQGLEEARQQLNDEKTVKMVSSLMSKFFK